MECDPLLGSSFILRVMDEVHGDEEAMRNMGRRSSVNVYLNRRLSTVSPIY